MRHGCIHFEEIKHAFSTNWQISYSNLTFTQDKKKFILHPVTILIFGLLEINNIRKRKYNICKTYKSIPVYYMSDKCTLSLPRVRVQNIIQYHTFQILRS